ncbi:MAG TPA: D-glycerate dehydrogenase [Thermoplasmatales archaeon]|nr:D-glycerate dehydrogenase [Thermoplasmatales archaeon]
MKVFVTRRIPEPGLELLRRECSVVEVYPHDRIPSKEEIIEGLRGKDGLLCLLTDKIDEDVITSNPKLRMISSYAAGYDNIDVETATKLGIPVSNTPDVLTDATAEMAWALLFAVARRIVEGDAFTREGRFKGWSPMLMLGKQVSGKTLGVVGAGRIGTAFALKGRGFNMKTLYFNRSRNRLLEEVLGAEKVSLEELMRESDFVSIHLPLTSETYHFIGYRELSLMKKDAILINTARGAIIDENALVEVLTEKRIFGAGLDVYEHEPMVDERLKKLSNVVLQPHTGSATREARTEMAIIAAENLITGLKGRKPRYCVNPEVFDRS